MDAIRVVYLHNDFMIRKMSIKPSQLNIPFTSLYPPNIIWQVMVFIVGRCCIFSYYDDNVVFTAISRMIFKTCVKMDDGVLTPLYLGLIDISLCLQCHVFIFTILQIIIKQCSCRILFFNGLLMVFLHFVCKRLSNMRKQDIAAMFSECFCQWLLTSN